MSVLERAKSRSRQLVGTAKQRLGQNTGNRRLASSGRRDRMVGNVRETTNEVRDWAATAARDARRRFGNRSTRPR
jgi:uncharacterized protein YjbJ (UPF0337 family)